MIDMYGKEFGVNTPLRVAHFLAKAREEITRYTYDNRLGMAMVKQMMNKKITRWLEQRTKRVRWQKRCYLA